MAITHNNAKSMTQQWKVVWFGLASISAALVVIVASLFHLWLYLIALCAFPILFVGVVSLLKRPAYAIILLAVYIPFETFLIKWLPLRLQTLIRFAPELLILALLSWVVISHWHQRRRILWYKNILNVPLAIFLSTALLSALINQIPLFILVLALKNLIRYIGLYYLLQFIPLKRPLIYLLFSLMFVIASIQAGLAGLETVGGIAVATFLRPQITGYELLSGVDNPTIAFGNAKPSGTIGIYSSYGAFLAFWATFLVAKMLIEQRNWYAVPALLLTTGVLLSRSRTSWLMLVLSVGVVVLFARKQLFGKVLFWTTIIIVTFSALGLLINLDPLGSSGPQLTDWNMLLVEDSGDKLVARPEAITQRLTELFSIDYWRNSSRLNTFLVTVPELLKHYPLFGVGPGTLGSEVTGGGSTSSGIYTQYSHEDWLDVPQSIIVWTADSGWVAILAQFGVFGLLAWWVFFLLLLQIAYHLYRTTTDLFVKSFSVAMVANIFLLFWATFSVHFLTYRAVSIYFWITAALLIQFYQESRKQILLND